MAIAGGGLTGVMAAYACAAAGIDAVLIEADRLGSGATGWSTGLVLAEPGHVPYLALEQQHGRRVARALWQGTRRAALDCQAAVRRLGIRCGLASHDAITVARTAEEARQLRRELQARQSAGLDGSWVSGRALAALGIAASAGLRTRGHARVDPVRACHGFARAAAARGARIFESTPLTRVRQARSGLELTTPTGQLTAETLVIATGEPTRPYSALARHFTPCETYAVATPPLPAALRRGLPDPTLVLQDVQRPPHRLFWMDDRIVWSGADGPRTPDRGRTRVLVQRTGQLMYELSLLFESISGTQPDLGWHAPYAHTADGLPAIGPHRNYPHHFFALGCGSNLSHAFLAGRVLLRERAGRAEREDDAFGFARLLR